VRGGEMRGTVRGINARRWVICEAGMCEAQPKKLLPVRTGLVAKSITSPEMFRYSTAASCTCALLAVHAHC